MRLLAYALLIALALPASPRAANDDAVTAQNLLANERHWPYHVALARRFVPLEAGTVGVLIRVEPAGLARIDFGRDGLFEVPVDATDLVERANRVRRGELSKKAPNFVLAIGPRLVDSTAEPPRQFPYERAARQRGFLAVFADPSDAGFEEMAQELAPVAEREGLLAILFPQGQHEDAVVFERLRAAGWRAPFVYSHLTAPYTRSLLPDALPRPALQLQTPEGRVLFQSGWREGVTAELREAVDAALGAS